MHLIAQAAHLTANGDFTLHEDLTEREAAEKLRMSERSLQRERVEGRIGFCQYRRRVFYPMSCIEAYRLQQIRPAMPTPTPQNDNDARSSNNEVRAALRRARMIKS